MSRPLKLTPILTVFLLASGCGQPQLAEAEEQDYRLVMQLNAAVGSRQEELLAQTFERIKDRHEQGKIPNAAFEALRSIVQQAQAGQWEQAHRNCLDFMKGQKGNPNFAR